MAGTVWKAMSDPNGSADLNIGLDPEAVACMHSGVSIYR